jgi:hypothetical protein
VKRLAIVLGSASMGHWPIHRRCGHECAAYARADFGRESSFTQGPVLVVKVQY